MKTKVIFIFLFCFGGSTIFKAQVKDSLAITADSLEKQKLTKKKIYSHARRAAVMSAILPGLGQGYNKKYWKIPIIYAGLGGFTYMFINNNTEYNYYSSNLRAINDGDPNTINQSGYDQNQLLTLKKQFEKNRDLAVIGFFAIYFLNIIDANVDGHLRTFDVSDDLGLQIDPWQTIRYTHAGKSQSVFGLSFKLTF